MIEGFTTVNPSVFTGEGDGVTVTAQAVAAVCTAAKLAPNGRARLILHHGADDILHEMIIALPPTSCDHPHINFRSGKSFMALSGRFAVMRFTDEGDLLPPVILDAAGKNAAIMMRLRTPVWHTIIPLEGEVAFLETNSGPFTGNFFAEWFPAEDGEREVYTENLRRAAREADTRS
ncbi:WbuC family cupin fold metalloprotein [Ahrensia sp. R2A130]|uniref:WbuC family cupin fold metalloprotein n=1 Tax=Ahrensia sp. R2A130 TaxID=744979 RepID=UPI0001E08C2A|nr:WbuC family cupin fold metalloprotein [Ahrensia sp. R2A130]EFL89528.1 conserved hypothetical protein [Ahrensia sp. R2A130]